MFCRNCQTIIPDDSIFCENCGAPTGLNPDEIEVKNLVPEDAVEFEVSEDAPQVASVPVDPVWWEPPEEPAGEGSWDDWDETEEINEQESQTEPEIQEPAAETPAGEEPAKAEHDEPETNEPEHHDRPDLKQVAAEAAEQAKPYLEKAKSILGDLGKNVRTGTGWAAEKGKQQLQHREEEPVETEEEVPGAPVESSEPQQPQPQKQETPAEWQEEDAPGAFDESTVSDEPEFADEPRESKITIETYEPEESEEPYEPEESYEPYEPYEPDEVTGQETRDAAEPEENAMSQVKPYLDKAVSLLGDLGKNVRNGTERAAEAAKQQFQQKKEEFEEKKELREKEKAEERQREEEQRQKDEEARRLAEQERQEELERRRERDEREQEEDMLQRPGFWYGQPEPEEIESTGEAEPAKGSELAALIADRDEEIVTKAGEPEAEPKQAEVIEPDAEPEPEPESEQEPELEPEPAPQPEPEAEPLPEHEIEDKLADTARFSWSEEELKEAAEHGIEPNLDKAPDEDSGEEGASEENGADGADEEATGEPDESSPYRIRDYEPYEGVQKKEPFFSKDRIRLIVIIAIVAAIVAGIAAAMIHQAHERQLAEEAYARSVKQAEQLVDARKYEEAEALYLKLMEQRPEDTQLYVELAQMYVDQQRYVDAKALIKRAIEITGDEESFAELKKDIKILTSTKWKKAYREVLRENESEIRRYEDKVQASCAICDVNGDMRPELFFFTGEYYGYGKLHIYTTVNNKAKEVEYECKSRGTKYHDAFYDVSPNDSSYAVFNSAETGKFSIYSNIVLGGDSWDTTNEYTLNLNGGCRRDNLLEGNIDTTYSEGENDDSEYEQNGEEISYDKYIGEFRKMLDQATQVILYNGSDDSGGDQAVWSKVNPDTVMCMSYDALMVDLKAK